MLTPAATNRDLKAVLLGSPGRRTELRSAIRKLRPEIEKHVRVVAEDFTGGGELTGLDADLAIDRYMTYIVTRQIKSTRPDLARLAAGQGVKPDAGHKD